MNKIFDSILIGYNRLPNRIVIPSMASQTADVNGFVTAKTIDHYLKLSKANAGLLMVEYTYVHLNGKSEPNQLGIDSDDKIAGLEKLVHEVKKNHQKIGIQITHCGAKTVGKFGDEVLSPSGIAVPLQNGNSSESKTMSLEKLLLWKKSFVEAAIRAQKAGFDFLEIHCAHGYGFNQFLSPYTNKRNDLYGGSLKNNLRLLEETIDEIKEKTALALSLRFPGQDFLEDGLSISDTIKISKILEKKIDWFNVSSGISGWRRPLTRESEGYLLEEAKEIAQNVKLPVAAVGGFESLERMNLVLNQTQVQLISVGRAILKDPISWGEKMLEYREKQ